MANNTKNSNMIVGLDIGTSKVVCIVGKYNESNKLEIIALGSYPSSGLKKELLLILTLQQMQLIKRLSKRSL